MMKKCFACFRANAGLAFSLFGAVVGAGFMTGAELVRFFPLRAAFAHAAVAAGLFAACFLLLFDAGRKCGGFEGALRCCGCAAPVFRALLHFASFITCAAMLAGLDGAVRTGFGLRYALPVAALCALPAMFFVPAGGCAASPPSRRCSCPSWPPCLRRVRAIFPRALPPLRRRAPSPL